MRNETINADRRRLLLAACGAGLASACGSVPLPRSSGVGADSLREDALTAMTTATRFMREKCAYNGGYVWSYAPDFSRQWGEMEAYPTMIWIQPPGTATVGHLYLDCYHATGDEFYYEAAAEVAEGLIAAQHSAGGWNYLHDFAGEESIRRWYDTIGKNGWRLEEFHHYYGNATFDDAGTSEASQFLLRMYLERKDEIYRAPLERAIRFVIDSQYDNGGWPQRFPFVDDAPSLHGNPDYTRHITFNDDVAGENIKFLLMVAQTLGDTRARDAIDRAMDIFIATQHPAPQAGWGLQHDWRTLQPVGARSYEPTSLVTSTTGVNVGLMLDFYQWTGERRFLERIPQALDWLESVRLPADEIRMPGREFPTFVELGTNRALFNHRRGSNVVNGEYYHDYEPDKPITHYSQWRSVDLDRLRQRFETLAATPASQVIGNSPLEISSDFRLPRYFAIRNIEVSDMNSNVGAGDTAQSDSSAVAALVDTLGPDGYWPTPLNATSNPYRGDGSPVPAPGDYSQSLVGDETDTSPYLTDDPIIGVSTGAFIQNMSTLLQYVGGPDQG